MRGLPTAFWGKLSTYPTGDQWHPLASHCADVAACTQRLLVATRLRQRLARWGGLSDLDETQVERLAVIAALHDIGKYNYGFQNKSQPHPPFVHGHVDEVLALFGSAHDRLQRRLSAALPVDELESWAPESAALSLLIAAVGHHGRPGRVRAISLHPSAWAPGEFGDPFLAIADLHAAARQWFPAAFASGGTSLPATPAFQHGFAGLVMLADWLGSDTNFFPFDEDGDPSARMAFARGQACIAAKSIGLDVAKNRLALGTAAPTFATISPFAPRPAQTSTLELPIDPQGGLSVLEAETGSGKTEAALARFMRLFHAGTVDGMVFALPTRTAATQLHRRICDAVQLAFPAQHRPAVILAVPGYLRFDDVEGRRLPGFEVLWNDDHRARERHRGWAAEQPKRYLAGAIVVGTIDQVLLSTLMVGHAHMRATCLARQLLVVDEVHASDAFMVELLEHVLRFHMSAGGYAFLMSATLGSEARTRLLATAGVRKSDTAFEHALQEPYPALCHVGLHTSLRRQAIEHAGPGKNVQIQVAEFAGDPFAVASTALEAACQGACVLVVRNLVRDCVDTQLAIEKIAGARGLTQLLFTLDAVLTPHHSRYAREDRKALDGAVESTFGKQRGNGVGKVLIATQTVEQSLDLDADLLITDLCPMDVLLQRIGRLHRHQRARPVGYERARTVVLAPAGRSLDQHIRRDFTAKGPHGYGSVYEDLRVLEATLQACEHHPHITIPRDNRALVEAATHPAALRDLAQQLGPAWVRHGEQVFGGTLSQRQLARMHVITRDLPFDGERMRFSTVEEVGKISTRLGDDDRMITFIEPMPGPFGQTIRHLTLPFFLLGTAPVDPLALVPASLQTDGSLRFSYGDTTYAYDRLGLRPAIDASLDREGEP